MTVTELIQKLVEFPPDTPVTIYNPHIDDSYEVESVKAQWTKATTGATFRPFTPAVEGEENAVLCVELF